MIQAVSITFAYVNQRHIYVVLKGIHLHNNDNNNNDDDYQLPFAKNNPIPYFIGYRLLRYFILCHTINDLQCMYTVLPIKCRTLISSIEVK